jgi:hypothetical protein
MTTQFKPFRIYYRNENCGKSEIFLLFFDDKMEMDFADDVPDSELTDTYNIPVGDCSYYSYTHKSAISFEIGSLRERLGTYGRQNELAATDFFRRQTCELVLEALLDIKKNGVYNYQGGQTFDPSVHQCHKCVEYYGNCVCGEYKNDTLQTMESYFAAADDPCWNIDNVTPMAKTICRLPSCSVPEGWTEAQLDPQCTGGCIEVIGGHACDSCQHRRWHIHLDPNGDGQWICDCLGVDINANVPK